MPDFDVYRFEDLIAERGRPIKWERARRCPCYNPRTRSAKENCPLCGGLSWVYMDMTQPGITFKATVLGIVGDRRFARFGNWLAGDAVMTFPASLGIGDMDRITLLDATHRESDLLIRGKRDRLVDLGVCNVLECGDETRDYSPGQDFDLVDGEIAWKGLQPADGATYSILYEARPVYVVWLQLPQDRTHVATPQADGTLADQIMPRKVAMRRWLDYVRGENAT